MGDVDPIRLLPLYGLDPASHSVRTHGSGLINRTWVVSDVSDKPLFILQRLNTNVFKRPEDVAHNMAVLGDYLAGASSDFLLPLPIETLAGDRTVVDRSGCFRLIPFVDGSTVYTVCSDASQAFEAALQFGRFTSEFEGLDTSMLRETIPGFHDLSHRWMQFEDALLNGDASRRRQSDEAIDFLSSRRDIVQTYERIREAPSFRLRVTHHDTKISNVLFDGNGRGLCVIDLDTVMPGRFISDVGDMFRTYLSPASEEESDFDRVFVRPGFKEAIRKGYLTHMVGLLTTEELEHFDYAGEFMIYMQALRFLTDHLNRDVYYGASYEGHNLVRARNQIRLLEAFGQS